MACTMTGLHCSGEPIPTTSIESAVNEIALALGLAPEGMLAGATVPAPGTTEIPTATIMAGEGQAAPSATTLPPAGIPPTSAPPTSAPPTSPPPTSPPPTSPPDTITICHCPQEDRTNCSTKTVPNDGSYDGHINHDYDIIPAPAGGCP
jgi:hypothetical protein